MKLPDLCHSIDSYELLEGVIETDFKRRRRNVLIVAAKGLGKTHRIKAAMRDVPHFYGCGHTAPTIHYTRALQATGRHIVYDDYSDAIRDDAIGELLKQQTETTGTRTVRWDGAVTAVPRPAFDTDSPVLLILNTWRAGPTWEALSDRCDVYVFEPSKAEWMAQVREWLANEGVAGGEVLAYMEQRVEAIARLTFRSVRRALDAARDGGAVPWRSHIDKICEGASADELLMREILLSPDYAHASGEAIVQAWRQQTGKGRSWGFEVLVRVKRRVADDAAAAAHLAAVHPPGPRAQGGSPDCPDGPDTPDNRTGDPSPPAAGRADGQTDRMAGLPPVVDLDRPVVRPPEEPPAADSGDWPRRWLEDVSD